jgi:hypothetical protein
MELRNSKRDGSIQPQNEEFLSRESEMKKESVKFTRAELYDKIWSTPATRLAEEFGISGRGLGKICARFDIPVPPRGYWAKFAFGKSIPKTELPPAKPNTVDEICIEPTQPEELKTISEAVRSEVATALEKRDLIRVPETLSSPHPIVAGWIDEKRERRLQDRLSGNRHTQPRMDSADRRRLRILSTLFKEVERLGHFVKMDRDNPYKAHAYFEIDGQRLDFKMTEHQRQVKIPLTPEERRWHTDRTTKTELEPTGELEFEITTWISKPFQKRWRDGERHKLEQQLADVIVGLIKASAAEKEWKRQRDEEERRRAELEAQHAEQERLRRIDVARWRHLNELREAAQRASLIREFIDRLEQRVRGENEGRMSATELQNWFSWARDKADAADPLLKSPEALIKHNLTITDQSREN